MKPKVLGLLAVGLMAASMAADATTFYFSQGGFRGGGTLTGSFSGVDLDGNGQLNSIRHTSELEGEITAYSMSFSGGTVVSAFSHDFSELNGLIYDIGSGFIGDGVGEGIWSWSNFFEYYSGPRGAGVPNGFVVEILRGAISWSPEMVSVSEIDVPEPGTLGLLSLGLVGLGFSRRRKA